VRALVSERFQGEACMLIRLEIPVGRKEWIPVEQSDSRLRDELLKAMPPIKRFVTGWGRRIPRKNLPEMSPTASPAVTVSQRQIWEGKSVSLYLATERPFRASIPRREPVLGSRCGSVSRNFDRQICRYRKRCFR